MIEFYAMMVNAGLMTLEQIDEYWRENVRKVSNQNEKSNVESTNGWKIE